MAEHRAQSRDTSLEVEEVLFAAYREMPVWRKLDKVQALNRGCRQMALVGLRRQYPDETKDQLALRLAAFRLGSEVMRDLAYLRDSASAGGVADLLDRALAEAGLAEPNTE